MINEVVPFTHPDIICGIRPSARASDWSSGTGGPEHIMGGPRNLYSFDMSHDHQYCVEPRTDGHKDVDLQSQLTAKSSGGWGGDGHQEVRGH